MHATRHLPLPEPVASGRVRTPVIQDLDGRDYATPYPGRLRDGGGHLSL